DEQRGGACAAAGGDKEEAIVRLPQRGGVPLRGAPAERDADPADARAPGVGLPRRGAGRTSPQPSYPSVARYSVSRSCQKRWAVTSALPMASIHPALRHVGFRDATWGPP